jgi:hypothetical protein
MRGKAEGSQIPINGSGKGFVADLNTVAMPLKSLSSRSCLIFLAENKGKSQGTISQATSRWVKKADNNPLIGPLEGTRSVKRLNSLVFFDIGSC